MGACGGTRCMARAAEVFADEKGLSVAEQLVELHDAMTARFIGFEDSPFQAEVGFASLGFAAVGLLAFRGSFDLRLAAVVGPALFLLGAAGGHLYQMIAAGNFAPGNAGVIFYTDILIPLIGFALLWLQRRYARERGVLAPARP